MSKSGRKRLDVYILDLVYVCDYLRKRDYELVGIQHCKHLPLSRYQYYILYTVAKWYSNIELGKFRSLKGRKDFKANTLRKINRSHCQCVAKNTQQCGENHFVDLSNRIKF